jgi:uncharacterized DUF497 family protein
MEVLFDPRKAQRNLLKHGVSFDEAMTALYDPMALCREDPDAVGEVRWVLIGMSSLPRLLTVVYALREDIIRIISARKPTQREEQFYAKGL